MLFSVFAGKTGTLFVVNTCLLTKAVSTNTLQTNQIDKTTAQQQQQQQQQQRDMKTNNKLEGIGYIIQSLAV